MPTVTLQHLNFYYEVEGDGFPLVLLAGLGCDSNHWRFVKAHLVKNFQIITLDNRSVGRTETPAHSYTIAEMGDDVLSLLDSLSLRKVHLLGHSMGGAIAQSIAHRAPEYIERLIISHSLAKFTPRALFWMKHCATLYEAEKNLEEIMPAIALEIFSSNFFKDPKNFQNLLAIKKSYPYPQTARGFRQQIEALAAFDSTKWIHQLSLPTCIFAGKEDVLAPLAQVSYLHEQIKNSRLILQEGAHVPMFEMPKQYAKDVKNFLTTAFPER